MTVARTSPRRGTPRATTHCAFAGLRATGFPERNRRGIEATLERLKDAAETDHAAAR